MTSPSSPFVPLDLAPSVLAVDFSGLSLLFDFLAFLAFLGFGSDLKHEAV